MCIMDTVVFPLILPLVCLSLLILCRNIEAKASVSATAPIEHVDEGGILSVHCEVDNLEQGQSVMVARQHPDGAIEALSLKDLVQTAEDDRVFLAVRQLPGNTFVYFLSIIDIKKEDAAEYICRVMGSDLASIAVKDSVNINVNYIPDETNPHCSNSLNSDSIIVKEGEMISFTCSSERGNPAISLHWTRNNKELKSDTEDLSLTVQSVLEFKARRFDDGSIFVCRLRSKAFPGHESTCHVGPIQVIFDSEVENVIDIDDPVLEVTDDVLHDVTTAVSTKRPIVVAAEKVQCQDICSLSSGPAFYWVVATITAGCLAVLFLIIGIVLLLRYCRISSRMDEHSLQTRQEDFYEKLQYGNRREEMVYMSLGNSNRMNMMKGKGNTEHAEVHYCLAPNKASYAGATRPLTD